MNQVKDAAAWNGFAPGNWQHEVDVRDFIQKNYEPYPSHTFLPIPSEYRVQFTEVPFPR